MIRETVSERIGSVIQAVADYALLEAEALEKEAEDPEAEPPLVQQVQARLWTWQGRVRERWGQLIEDELAKMESHRNALIGVVHSWKPESSEAVQQGIVESQPGLS